MIIGGAGGHARELLGILEELDQTKDVFLFDDVSENPPLMIWERFHVFRDVLKIKKLFLEDPRFIIGVGKPMLRKLLDEKLTGLGGKAFSLISPFAKIGTYNVHLQEGLNIMTGAVITQDVSIGKCTLVHINATVHHDCRIGEYCELSPGCHLLGKVTLADFVSVGCNAVVLPGIHVGEKAIIGAGAVVTKDVPAGSVVKGIPAH